MERGASAISGLGGLQMGQNVKTSMNVRTASARRNALMCKALSDVSAELGTS